MNNLLKNSKKNEITENEKNIIMNNKLKKILSSSDIKKMEPIEIYHTMKQIIDLIKL